MPIALMVSAGLVTLAGLAAGRFVYRNMTYARRETRRVRQAGFTEKQVTVSGSRVHYAEGPDNGPPLLLIHGQVVDWQSWNRVLPELSRHYHVFAVDCYGHGKSERVPEKYRAVALAADMRQFLSQMVGEPATVAGHSSGGLVAAVLAAEAPEQVRGVVLEDPPFFSSVLPRAEKSFNYVDLASTAEEFLGSGETDFTSYYIRHGAMWELFQGAKEPIQKQALSYRRKHPGEPVKVFFLPPSINELFRGMEGYDPRFGVTFSDGSFHEGFDHAETLARISVPAVLIHTNWRYDDNGVLQAAMSGEDAERARSLIRGVEFYKVETGHGFHVEDPDRFIEVVRDFEQRVRG